MVMQNLGFKERRMFDRMPSRLSLRYSDLRSNKDVLAETHNISAQGISLLISKKLPPHASLEIWLQLPEKDEPLYIKGEVIWSNRIGKNKYIAGISLEKAELMISRVLA